jgi:hypothetical protein
MNEANAIETHQANVGADPQVTILPLNHRIDDAMRQTLLIPPIDGNERAASVVGSSGKTGGDQQSQKRTFAELDHSPVTLGGLPATGKPVIGALTAERI